MITYYAEDLSGTGFTTAALRGVSSGPTALVTTPVVVSFSTRTNSDRLVEYVNLLQSGGGCPRNTLEDLLAGIEADPLDVTQWFEMADSMGKITTFGAFPPMRVAIVRSIGSLRNAAGRSMLTVQATQLRLAARYPSRCLA